MARYIGSLSYECKERIASFAGCVRGVVLAIWAAWRYPQAILGRQGKEDTLSCSTALRALRIAESRLSLLPEEEKGGPTKLWLQGQYVRHLRRCAKLRRRELRRLLPEATAAFSLNELTAGRPWVGGRPKIGVIIALATRDGDFYARTLDLWRCYCRRHQDCEVALETADFLEQWRYPYVYEIETHTGLPKKTVGKAWNRWFALRRHLDVYEWVFTADPDQFPSHQCFSGVPLSEALTLAMAGNEAAPPPVVVMRDFPRFHTLNSAGVFFRGGAAARLFLSLLFGRTHWEGIADFDQSAFDHTVLEFLDLWANAVSGAPLHSPSCLVFQFPTLGKKNVLEPYVRCWHDFVDRLLGPFGRRGFGAAPLRLVDPGRLDLDYVVGGRTREDPPLLWHLAGKNKQLTDPPENGGLSMLDRFLKGDWGLAALPPGLGLAAGEPNCTPWEEAAGPPALCDPGTKVVDCRMPWMAVC